MVEPISGIPEIQIRKGVNKIGIKKVNINQSKEKGIEKEKIISGETTDKEEFAVNYTKSTITAIVIWCILAIISLYINKIWIYNNMIDFMTKLSNIFFVSGIVELALGIIVFASSDGLFDGMAYNARSAKNLLHPEEPRESYYEYKTRMSKKTYTSRPIFITAGISLLFAIVFTVIYFHLK